jgi:hypothetical protein
MVRFEKALAEVGASGDIPEIVDNMAVNISKNYFNPVARTEVDFPAVAVNGLK